MSPEAPHEATSGPLNSRIFGFADALPPVELTTADLVADCPCAPPTSIVRVCGTGTLVGEAHRPAVGVVAGLRAHRLAVDLRVDRRRILRLVLEVDRDRLVAHARDRGRPVEGDDLGLARRAAGGRDLLTLGDGLVVAGRRDGQRVRPGTLVRKPHRSAVRVIAGLRADRLAVDLRVDSLGVRRLVLERHALGASIRARNARRPVEGDDLGCLLAAAATGGDNDEEKRER